MGRDRKRGGIRTGDYSLEELRILRPLIRPGDPQYIGRYPYDGYEEAKPHIFARDGYVCRRCGRTIGDTYFSPFYGRIYEFTERGFVVHHINGNPRDQRWVNLEVVCDSCNRRLRARTEGEGPEGS